MPSGVRNANRELAPLNGWRKKLQPLSDQTLEVFTHRNFFPHLSFYLEYISKDSLLKIQNVITG